MEQEKGKKPCRICDLQEMIGSDLDERLHLGFTIGKRGRTMFWYIVWHSTGNASVYTSEHPARRRFISGDQLIMVHYKN